MACASSDLPLTPSVLPFLPPQSNAYKRELRAVREQVDRQNAELHALRSGVALPGGAAAASRQGLAALPAAAQLACCVVWVTTVARWGVSFVLCAWFMNTRGGEVAPLAGYFAQGFRGDAAFTLPALAAHAALLLLRPLPLLWAWRVAARAAEARGAAAGPSLASMHAAV